MHPEIAKTLVEQRHEELTHTAESGRTHQAGSSWLSHHLPRWHVSWSRTVLSPAGRARHRGQRSPGPLRQARIVRGDHHLGLPLGLDGESPGPGRSGQGGPVGDISGLLERGAANQLASGEVVGRQLIG